MNRRRLLLLIIAITVACGRKAPEFPDPDAKGRFDVGGTGIGPGGARMEEAMAACDKAGLRKGGRIMIGG